LRRRERLTLQPCLFQHRLILISIFPKIKELLVFRVAFRNPVLRGESTGKFETSAGVIEDFVKLQLRGLSLVFSGKLSRER